jgi:hypothetical protein
LTLLREGHLQGPLIVLARILVSADSCAVDRRNGHLSAGYVADEIRRAAPCLVGIVSEVGPAAAALGGGPLMPEMELFGPDLRLCLISGIWRRLLSYMFWPDNEQQRQAYCTLPLVGALSSIDEKSASDPDYADAYHIVHDAFRRGGGWRALDKAGFPNPKRCGVPLRTAAAVLDIIRRAPRDGSLNKAVHVVSKTARTYDLIGNRTRILRAWKSHRSVAHLGVALGFLGEFRDQSEFDDPRRLVRFITIAHDYQDFAVSYRPPRQSKSLISRAENLVDLRGFARRPTAVAASAPTATGRHARGIARVPSACISDLTDWFAEK